MVLPSAAPVPAAKFHKGNQKGEAKRLLEAAAAASSGGLAPPAGEAPPFDEIPPSASSSGLSGPEMQAMFNRFSTSLDSRLISMETKVATELGAVSSSLDGALVKMADRMDAYEATTKTQIDDIHAKIKAMEIRMATAPAAAASASSSSAPAIRIPSFVAPATSGKPADDCVVFIRGFPILLPSFAMKDYIKEALSILSPSERGMVRVRSSQADDQFSLVFPDACKADAFIESYRTYGFCFIDPADDDKIEVTLKVSKSKPLPMRRRGAAIRPVYAMLEEILLTMPTLRSATITQRQAPRKGIWATEFYAQCGRSLALLFTLRFREDPNATVITEVVIPEAGSALSAEDLMLINAAADLQ
jgi:hypothetical protein